jgi:cytoskeletal protein RodZ
MKTVGEILKKARTDKHISLESVSQRTKINLRYLKAIEDNRFSDLPASAFTKGFMRNYALSIDLNPEHILAVFRRDYDQDEKGRIIPRGITKPLNASQRAFNPTTTAILLSAVASLIITGFFIWQIIDFRSAPSLTVSEPSDQLQTTSPVTVTGKTNPEATITVNNRPVTVREDGAFSTSLPLSPGEHTLVVSARSRNNKTTLEQRTVIIGQN